MRRDTSELLAAYVDGVTELSADERRRIEARLTAEPALRGDADATRELLGELRDLPRSGEPDWSALERSINQAVGPDAPKRWRGWRWLVPAVALAAAGAIAALVLHDPQEPVTAVDPIAKTTPPPPVPAEQPSEDLPFWLNGQAVEVELEALDAIEAELADDEAPADDGLMSTSDLGWVDALDEAALDRAERWLDDRPSRKRKKS
ncbi:MAG TPA: hypothetical protein VIU61_03065 [Kofleriaceae bacterium]